MSVRKQSNSVDLYKRFLLESFSNALIGYLVIASMGIETPIIPFNLFSSSEHFASGSDISLII